MTVTLYAAGVSTPTKLAEAQTHDHQARRQTGTTDGVLYVVAKGGTPKVAASTVSNDEIALLAVLGSRPPQAIIVNELATVASVFTAARFINGESISGHPLGLEIAARERSQSRGSRNGSRGAK